MKKLTFVVFLVLPFCIAAQDYRNICTPGLTFFIDHASNIKGFRFDSASDAGNGDTLFRTFFTINAPESEYGCADTSHGNLFRKLIFKKHDGWFFFFEEPNVSIDTAFLKTQARINESWKFCNLPDSGYLLATCTGVITATLAGVTDSVKVITFQAKDKYHQNTSNIFNQKEISLSKSHGFFTLFDLSKLPADTTLYSFCGKTVPPIGMQDLTWEMVYNFNAGDIFHYSGSISASDPHMSTSAWKIIRMVLSKTTTANGVEYQVEECSYRIDFYYPGGFNTTRYHDTITWSYDFPTLNLDTTFWKLPDEFDQGNTYSRDTKIYNNRLKKVITLNNFYNIYYPDGACWSSYFNPGIVREHQYAEGLGEVLSRRIDMNLHTWTTESLVYFKKGTETWGTPVASDCDSLMHLGIQEECPTSLPFLKVVPNPAETGAEILVGNPGISPKITILLYDRLCRLLFQETGTSPFHLDRNNLPAGIYFLKAEDDNGMIVGTGKVVFE